MDKKDKKLKPTKKTTKKTMINFVLQANLDELQPDIPTPPIQNIHHDPNDQLTIIKNSHFKIQAQQIDINNDISNSIIKEEEDKQILMNNHVEDYKKEKSKIAEMMMVKQQQLKLIDDDVKIEKVQNMVNQHEFQKSPLNHNIKQQEIIDQNIKILKDLDKKYNHPLNEQFQPPHPSKSEQIDPYDPQEQILNLNTILKQDNKPKITKSNKNTKDSNTKKKKINKTVAPSINDKNNMFKNDLMIMSEVLQPQLQDIKQEKKYNKQQEFKDIVHDRIQIKQQNRDANANQKSIQIKNIQIQEIKEKYQIQIIPQKIQITQQIMLNQSKPLLQNTKINSQSIQQKPSDKIINNHHQQPQINNIPPYKQEMQYLLIQNNKIIDIQLLDKLQDKQKRSSLLISVKKKKKKLKTELSKNNKPISSINNNNIKLDSMILSIQEQNDQIDHTIIEKEEHFKQQPSNKYNNFLQQQQQNNIGQNIIISKQINQQSNIQIDKQKQNKQKQVIRQIINNFQQQSLQLKLQLQLENKNIIGQQSVQTTVAPIDTFDNNQPHHHQSTQTRSKQYQISQNNQINTITNSKNIEQLQANNNSTTNMKKQKQQQQFFIVNTINFNNNNTQIVNKNKKMKKKGGDKNVNKSSNNGKMANFYLQLDVMANQQLQQQSYTKLQKQKQKPISLIQKQIQIQNQINNKKNLQNKLQTQLFLNKQTNLISNNKLIILQQQNIQIKNTKNINQKQSIITNNQKLIEINQNLQIAIDHLTTITQQSNIQIQQQTQQQIKQIKTIKQQKIEDQFLLFDNINLKQKPVVKKKQKGDKNAKKIKIIAKKSVNDKIGMFLQQQEMMTQKIEDNSNNMKKIYKQQIVQQKIDNKQKIIQQSQQQHPEQKSKHHQQQQSTIKLSITTPTIHPTIQQNPPQAQILTISSTNNNQNIQPQSQNINKTISPKILQQNPAKIQQSIQHAEGQHLVMQNNDDIYDIIKIDLSKPIKIQPTKKLKKVQKVNNKLKQRQKLQKQQKKNQFNKYNSILLLQDQNLNELLQDNKTKIQQNIQNNQNKQIQMFRNNNNNERKGQKQQNQVYDVHNVQKIDDMKKLDQLQVKQYGRPQNIIQNQIVPQISQQYISNQKQPTLSLLSQQSFKKIYNHQQQPQYNITHQQQQKLHSKQPNSIDDIITVNMADLDVRQNKKVNNKKVKKNDKNKQKINQKNKINNHSLINVIIEDVESQNIIIKQSTIDEGNVIQKRGGDQKLLKVGDENGDKIYHKGQTNKMIESSHINIKQQIIQPPPSNKSPNPQQTKPNPQIKPPRQKMALKDTMMKQLINLVRFHNNEQLTMMRQRMNMLQQDIISRTIRAQGLKLAIIPVRGYYQDIIQQNLRLKDQYKLLNHSQ